MKLKIFFSIIVFVSSYFPLVIVLIIKDFDFSKNQFHNLTLVSILSACTLLSCAITLIASKMFKDGVLVSLTKVSNKSTDMFTYTIPYMLSFYKFDLSDLNMLLSLAAFMSWMFIVSYRSQSLFVNPVLAVVGYGLYDCQFKDTTSERHGLILSKIELEVGSVCRIQKLSGFLYFSTSKI